MNNLLNHHDLKELLYSKFDRTDFEKAKKDIIPFIKDPNVVDIWSADFFKKITEEFLLQE